MAKEIRHIIKRKDHRQEYDEKKVYASVYAAALNCHYSESKSEDIAKDAMLKINSWIKDKPITLSSEIKEEVSRYLEKLDEDVAMMYEHHRNLC